jgi:hypothetical protein
LNKIDGNSKDILGCRNDLLVLLGIAFELFIQIDLPPIEGILMLLECNQTWHFHALDESLVFFEYILVCIVAELLLISCWMVLATLPISLELR